MLLPQAFPGIAACTHLKEAIWTGEPTAAGDLSTRNMIEDFAGKGNLSHSSDAASALPYTQLG